MQKYVQNLFQLLFQNLNKL